MLRKSDTSATASTHWFRKLGIVMVMAVALALAGASSGLGGADTGEMHLEAAVHREIVLGDLKGAMEQYRAVLAQSGKSRAIAARALFGIGQCQEKSGRRNEARTTYTRLVNEYSDQPETVARARAQLAGWEDPLPGPRNLKFEQGVPGKVPPGWFVPALPKDADYLAELRRKGCRSESGCAVVLVPANAPSAFGNLMQSFSAAAYAGKTVRLRAWLRLESSDPGDRAQMWLSVDRANRQKGSNIVDRPVLSAEWTRCEIVSPIERDATFINFGVSSVGRGRVWVDGVSFEVIPKQ
ncbi:MAG TPA: tetratricopeptide repeat protein [Bryobacteraceae bacterium]|nr:tetratricopeptide repeat protein [Bryobacteraceae bacterium]